MQLLKYLFGFNSLGWLIFCVPQLAWGGVTAEVSRVVYEAAKPEQSLQLANLNDYPVLVQLWIDDGNPGSTPDKATYAPVISLPAIFNLAAGEQRSIRLVRVREDLPEDRESLYWLNIYEVPPKPLIQGSSAEQLVLLTMRTQMKLFFRPESLSAKAVNMIESVKLDWREGKLQINNQGPFFLTITRIEFDNLTPPLQPQMLAPFSSESLELPIKPLAQSASIYYLDDYGVEQLWKVAL
ncbi:fimbrial biogenesis chaperone [Shewanella algae]|uniref:fimbrial biogenesis chaperone n=1 Tax=Shewanella algae TaxID=38313 RepID=UPI001AACAF78|nr:molecular chaperone [Shewanella algae]MBO2651602.1 molecular chaperone [Shewanella algae]